MVDKRRYIRSAALPIVAISSLTILNGCKESDPAPKNLDDLLMGDWQVIELDGESQPGPDEYVMNFKFKANGDFSQCVEYLNNDAYYCMVGKWTWSDASKPELRLVRKDEPVITADVVDIDDSNMEWNTSYDLDGVTVTNNAKFVKID
jgi:hypothetical protein